MGADDGLWRRCGVVVLTGGTSSRLGTDKTALPLAGRPAPARLLDDVPPGVPVVVVGPSHPSLPDVTPAREEPPGGGPVAGLVAGVAALPPQRDVVLVVAGDLPFAGPVLRRLLARLAAEDDAAAVLGADPAGRRQPLLAGYRRPALAAALSAAPATGRSLRDLVAGLGQDRVVLEPVSAREALDLDTEDDVRTALAYLADDARESAR